MAQSRAAKGQGRALVDAEPKEGGPASLPEERPPVALFSSGGRFESVRHIAEAELRDAFRVRWCGRLDDFGEELREAGLGVAVGGSGSEAGVFEAVDGVANRDATPSLILVVSGTPVKEQEGAPPPRAPCDCEWLAHWEVPAALLRTTTAALIRVVLDRRQRSVTRSRELRVRSPELSLALIRVLERTEDPIVEVQRLTGSLPEGYRVSSRRLESQWADLDPPRDMTLKRVLMVVVLLRALLLHLERPELSWSEVALEVDVVYRTLARYSQRYLSTSPGRLRPSDIPRRVVGLEGLVLKAVG